jgi:hypothetical protein
MLLIVRLLFGYTILDGSVDSFCELLHGLVFPSLPQPLLLFQLFFQLAHLSLQFLDLQASLPLLLTLNIRKQYALCLHFRPQPFLGGLEPSRTHHPVLLRVHDHLAGEQGGHILLEVLHGLRLVQILLQGVYLRVLLLQLHLEVLIGQLELIVVSLEGLLALV